MNNPESALEILLAEYNTLKSEQAQRIGFRDNLLYVTLGLFGGVMSFALSEDGDTAALLVIPWICLILGWTYVINDEKISAIGRYIRNNLNKKLRDHIGSSEYQHLFEWEVEHRSDPHRRRRKIQQLIVDEITFVASGWAALLTFGFLTSQPSWHILTLCSVEALLLLVLGIEIIMYSDRQIGKNSPQK
ncbi:MAG: hypothetical protein F6J87_15795 [Spirulina sp. SIO3F2]|nr:hypothetical protein [Spirulina sp. SIO3F2]